MSKQFLLEQEVEYKGKLVEAEEKFDRLLANETNPDERAIMTANREEMVKFFASKSKPVHSIDDLPPIYLIDDQIVTHGHGMTFTTGSDIELVKMISLHQALEVARDPIHGQAVFMCNNSDSYVEYIDRYVNHYNLNPVEFEREFTVLEFNQDLSKAGNSDLLEQKLKALRKDNDTPVSLLVVSNFTDQVEGKSYPDLKSAYRNVLSQHVGAINNVHTQNKDGELSGHEFMQLQPRFVVRVERNVDYPNLVNISCITSHHSDGIHNSTMQLLTPAS